MTALAIFVSDVHLSHKAPSLRVDEPDWYGAMDMALRELYHFQKELGKPPIIYAGDIFDHWKSPPELINFALQTLPPGFAIPGQHDLPNHSYEEIEKSAYWTLVEGGVIKTIEPGVPAITERLTLHGFPWGYLPTPCHRDSMASRHIAVIHEYCWTGKHKYLTAPPENEASSFDLTGYDYAVFGDNHIGFVQGNICNTGGFMRRHKPDMNREPFVGVLDSKLGIRRHLLTTCDDIYSLTDDDVEETGVVDLGEFTDGLLALRNSKELDFSTLIRRYCREHEISSLVDNVIQSAIERENE